MEQKIFLCYALLFFDIIERRRLNEVNRGIVLSSHDAWTSYEVLNEGY